MVGLASWRARRAAASCAALAVLCAAWPVVAAKPRPGVEPDSDDVTFEVTDPGPDKKGKGKSAGAKGKKTPAKPAAKPATPKSKATPKAKPAPKPASDGKVEPAAPESDDVVLTTTTADGTKVEEITLEEEEDAEPPLEEAAEEAPSTAKKNWAGLYFQQDSLIFSSVKNVCRGLPSSDT